MPKGSNPTNGPHAVISCPAEKYVPPASSIAYTFKKGWKYICWKRIHRQNLTSCFCGIIIASQHGMGEKEVCPLGIQLQLWNLGSLLTFWMWVQITEVLPFPTTIFSSSLEEFASSCLIDIPWQWSAQASPMLQIGHFNFQTYSCEDPGCPVWIIPGQNWKKKNKQTDPQLFSLLKDFEYFWTSMIPFANTSEKY